MKCELINKEEVIRKFKIDDISLMEMTTLKILIEDEIDKVEENLKYLIENNVKNKSTEWLEEKTILLKNMLKTMEGE